MSAAVVAYVFALPVGLYFLRLMADGRRLRRERRSRQFAFDMAAREREAESHTIRGLADHQAPTLLGSPDLL